MKKQESMVVSDMCEAQGVHLVREGWMMKCESRGNEHAQGRGGRRNVIQGWLKRESQGSLKMGMAGMDAEICIKGWENASARGGCRKRQT